MKFTKTNLLNDVVLDYDNPEKIYKLAREYDRLEQGAGAFSWYLRAADMSNGKTFMERWLQYKCMILSSMIYDRSDNRNHSTEGLLKIAIETMPERPEAFYFLAKFKQERDDWRESLMYSSIGISNIENGTLEDAPDNDIGYPGSNSLRILYARAKWKTDGRDESKKLAFNLKHKSKLTKDQSVEVDELLSQHGYPSTQAYTEDEYDRFKFKFDGLESVKQNHSRHFQDLFVLAALNGKRNGTYVELGSGHPELYNNTLVLERDFGWKGLSIDNSERMCHIFSKERNTSVLLADAGEIDYRSLFKQHCFERKIDFIRFNAESASIRALENMPFDSYEFGVIQFQHNGIWWGDSFRKASREYLSKIGYVLVASDIAVDPKSPYEDWWVHPLVANTQNITKMKSINKINFAWDYMMEKIK